MGKVSMTSGENPIIGGTQVPESSARGAGRLIVLTNEYDTRVFDPVNRLWVSIVGLIAWGIPVAAVTFWYCSWRAAHAADDSGRMMSIGLLLVLTFFWLLLGVNLIRILKGRRTPELCVIGDGKFIAITPSSQPHRTEFMVDAQTSVRAEPGGISMKLRRVGAIAVVHQNQIAVRLFSGNNLRELESISATLNIALDRARQNPVPRPMPKVNPAV